MAANLLLRPVVKDDYNGFPVVFVPRQSAVVVGVTHVRVQREVSSREEAVAALRDAGLVVTREWLTDNTPHGGGAQHAIAEWHWER